MNASISSYHESPPSASPSSGTIHDLRFLFTENLILESRHLKEVRAEYHEAGTDTVDLDLHISAIDGELERRRQFYRTKQGMPAWPLLDDERYHRLLADAHELKAIWPLADFLTTIVGLRLHGRGGELSGDCPFHESESKASFKVSTTKNLWHCWGCGTGGDLFRFVGEHYDITSFADQVRKVEQITGSMIESARITSESGEEIRREFEAVLR